MIRCGINFVCLQNGDGSYKVVYHYATASLVGWSVKSSTQLHIYNFKPQPADIAQYKNIALACHGGAACYTNQLHLAS